MPQNDYLAASVTLANARQRLLQAENALEYARAAYNRFLGRRLDEAVALDPALDIDNLVPSGRNVEDLIAHAISQRPELSALALQASALRSQSDAARASSRPQLALTGGYMFLENEFLDDDAFWVAGVSLQWNLFDGGQARKQAAALDSRYSAGASTNVEVLDAEALREQSLSNRDDARFELVLAKLRLARAIGSL